MLGELCRGSCEARRSRYTA